MGLGLTLGIYEVFRIGCQVSAAMVRLQGRHGRNLTGIYSGLG